MKLDRRIIFVGQTSGGLATKKALNDSKNGVEDHIQNVHKCTAAIAFLGTPHLGADLAKWAKLGSRIARVFNCANGDILDGLQTGSEILAKIQDNFHKMLRLREISGNPVLIACYYEQLPLPIIGDVRAPFQS